MARISRAKRKKEPIDARALHQSDFIALRPFGGHNQMAKTGLVKKQHKAAPPEVLKG
jgi:hypothetical protein